MLLRVTLASILCCKLLLHAQTFDLNTTLMESTFKVGGPARPPQVGMTVGTAFFIGKPIPLTLGQGWYVLVSAAHVFDDIAGPDLHIVFRRKQPDGTYQIDERMITFRVGETNLYVKHQWADVTAMYVNLPPGLDIPLLGMSELATEETFKQLKIHPNEELTSLGYPLGESSPWEFPILRSGRLASYPILPLTVVRFFLFDFKVFEGNSGGPVYIYAPNIRFAEPGRIPLSGYVQTIVGLVSQQRYSTNRERVSVNLPSKLDRGVIVPSQFIKETVEMLPMQIPPDIKLKPVANKASTIFGVRK